MAKQPPKKKPIEQYEHRDKRRVNNPPVGLVSANFNKHRRIGRQKQNRHVDTRHRLRRQKFISPSGIFPDER